MSRRSHQPFPSTTVTFDPDPHGLLPAMGPQSGSAAIRQFRVQRPRDLVNLDVTAYGCELVQENEQPWLRPAGQKAWIEVHFPFQHLGEQSFDGEEGSPKPPIQARTAYRTRLVFTLPQGEKIKYSVEGVLKALSRLPLVVVPLALPAPTDRELLNHIPVVALAGGISLLRGKQGLVLAETPGGTAAPTGDRLANVLQALAQARHCASAAGP